MRVAGVAVTVEVSLGRIVSISSSACTSSLPVCHRTVQSRCSAERRRPWQAMRVSMPSMARGPSEGQVVGAAGASVREEQQITVLGIGEDGDLHLPWSGGCQAGSD